MPDKEQLLILWSERALQNTLAIKKYLLHNFSNKELLRFYSLLSAFEEAVKIFPELYPQSNISQKIRRAVLSKQLSAFYRITSKQIEVLAILDNRCDISKWL